MIDFCIRDNFKTFLDSDHYEYVPISDRLDARYNRVKHRYFQEKFSILPPIFNHVDAHTVDGLNYLRRCVERFETELKNGERKLFLQVVAESASTTKNFFSNFETLNTFSKNPIFLRIVIRKDHQNTPYPNFEFSERMHGRYACCYVTPTSKWLATQFEDMGEDLLLARFVCNYFSREIS